MSGLRMALRVCAAGLSYVVFGVGTLLLTLSVFPVLCLLQRDPERRRRRLQRVFSGGCRFFIGFMRTLGLVDWQVDGREHLRGRGQVVLANHPSLIDAVFLLAWMPEAVCILKAALTHNLFLGWAVAAVGYVDNADPEQLINDCVAAVEGGNNLIVFPEGTRSVPGQQLRFRRGAARIALSCRAPVVLVQISCEPAVLTKALPWYRLPDRRARYRFRIRAPLSTASFRVGPEESTAQAARRLTATLEDYWPAADASLSPCSVGYGLP